MTEALLSRAGRATDDVAKAAHSWSMDNRMQTRIVHHILCACYAAVDGSLTVTMWIELLVAVTFHVPWLKPTLFCMLYIFGSAALLAYCVVGNSSVWAWLEAIGPVRSSHAHTDQAGPTRKKRKTT